MTTDKKVFSLLQLLQSVSSVISKTYNRSYWIKAEIAKVNEYKYSGHCYPELVEKQNGKVVAQIRGIIWAKTFKEISKKFEEVTKEPLKEGMMVVLLARVDFNPLHGFSVNITDIDPAYTLGDMLREKNLAIERLRKERIFEQNKTLKLPVLPRRIAVISVGTSKGFQDFNNVLADFKNRYKPFIRLFPALLQGDRAVESLMKALAEVARYETLFDTVLILRGGGSDIGLNCYDDYELAAAVARCPLPVVTGIGHSTNETVVEMVAWKNMITPTETAYFLMTRFSEFEKAIQKISNATVEIAQNAIDREDKLLRYQGERLKNAVRHKNLNMSHKVSLQLNNLKSLIRNILFNKEAALVHASQKLCDHAQANLKNGARRLDVQKNLLTQMPPVLIKNAENRLEMSRIKISSYDLNAVLDRGFSITRFDGKVIGNPASLNLGDAIHTELKNGEIISIIKKITSNG